jgi:hypothetical protein
VRGRVWTGLIGLGLIRSGSVRRGLFRQGLAKLSFMRGVVRCVSARHGRIRHVEVCFGMVWQHRHL